MCKYFNLILIPLTNRCTTCVALNNLLPYFDEETKTCVSEKACSATTVLSTSNKACIKCSNISHYKSMTHSTKILIDFIYCYKCETTLIYRKWNMHKFMCFT